MLVDLTTVLHLCCSIQCMGLCPPHLFSRLSWLFAWRTHYFSLLMYCIHSNITEYYLTITFCCYCVMLLLLLFFLPAINSPTSARTSYWPHGLLCFAVFSIFLSFDLFSFVVIFCCGTLKECESCQRVFNFLKNHFLVRWGEVSVIHSKVTEGY